MDDLLAPFAHLGPVVGIYLLHYLGLRPDRPRCTGTKTEIAGLMTLVALLFGEL